VCENSSSPKVAEVIGGNYWMEWWISGSVVRVFQLQMTATLRILVVALLASVVTVNGQAGLLNSVQL